MPHVVVKMSPGQSDAQTARIADAITRAVAASAGSGEDAISVAIEDVDPKDWVETVFRREILAKPRTLFEKPGYDPS